MIVVAMGTRFAVDWRVPISIPIAAIDHPVVNNALTPDPTRVARYIAFGREGIELPPIVVSRCVARGWACRRLHVVRH
jgi:hypothetical protein